jgi:hypothetical protein
MLRRTLLLLTAAMLVAVMMALTAGPAIARGKMTLPRRMLLLLVAAVMGVNRV